MTTHNESWQTANKKRGLAAKMEQHTCVRCKKQMDVEAWRTKQGVLADSVGAMLFEEGAVCDACLGEAYPYDEVAPENCVDQVRDLAQRCQGVLKNVSRDSPRDTQ